MEREFLEAQLAAGRSLEQIGRLVGKHPSTVGYWLKKHGLVAAHHAEYAPRGGITRERLAELAELGLKTRALAPEAVAWPADSTPIRPRWRSTISTHRRSGSTCHCAASPVR